MAGAASAPAGDGTGDDAGRHGKGLGRRHRLTHEAVYCGLAAPKVEGQLRRDGRRIEIADG